MGKTLSKDSNYEEYLLLFKKIDSLKDVHYGDIDIMESQDKKQILAMKDKKFQSIEMLREQLGQLRKRRDNVHPNLIQVLEYFVMSEDNFCTSISRLIWTMEYIKKDLTVEIRQRKLQQVAFELYEIKQIAFACISAFANLQRDGIHFGDVRAQNILLTNQLEVKLLDPVIEPNPPLLIQVFQSPKSRKGIYLAPNFLKLVKQKTIPHKLTTHKSEVFSLGFVLMEACLLNEQDECFDYGDGTINLQNYKKSLDQIQETYGEEISSLLKEMTNFNEKQRCDFIQLEQKYNLNSKLDKPLQSSQFLQDYSSNRLPTSQSQIRLNGDHSLSQISHLDKNKKSSSQTQFRPLRQYDLLSKNQEKVTVNTDRSHKAKDNYYYKNNYQSNLLHKTSSFNVDNKNLPTNNSFVSNAESMIPYIQNLDNFHSHSHNRTEKDKSTPFSRNKSNNQIDGKNNKGSLKSHFDLESATPKNSISFIQQENFENQNQNTLNNVKGSKNEVEKENERTSTEFKKNSKLQGQLQNFYSNMRNQNDISFLNSSLKLNNKNISNFRSNNNLLQSMRIDQTEDEKENLNSSNVEILKCLKEDGHIEEDNNNNNNNNESVNLNHDISQLSQRSNANNQQQQQQQDAQQGQTQQGNNVTTPKRQQNRATKNKTYDSTYSLYTNDENKKQNQSFLNPIKEEQNEQQCKTSPQLPYLSMNGDDEISAIDPQSTTNRAQTNQINRGINQSSAGKKFFNVSEIKFEGMGGQFSDTTNFMNTKYSANPQQGHNHLQSFFNQSNCQPSFIEAQSFYLQQRSASYLFEVIEETYEDGSVYNGEKLKGKRHGHGKFSYADGGYYEGSWFEGFMEGYGKLFYPSGKLAYEGEWKKDKFTGQGVVYNDTPENLGENQEFDYTDFDQMGECWIQYEGGFLDDQKQGQGTLLLSNGNKFIGGFLNDMVEGKGVFINSQGKEIKAHFSQNKLLQLL